MKEGRGRDLWACHHADADADADDDDDDDDDGHSATWIWLSTEPHLWNRF